MQDTSEYAVGNGSLVAKTIHVEPKNIRNMTEDMQTCFEILMSRVDDDARRIEELQDYWFDTNSQKFMKKYAERRSKLTKQYEALKKTLTGMKAAALSYDNLLIAVEGTIDAKLKEL